MGAIETHDKSYKQRKITIKPLIGKSNEVHIWQSGNILHKNNSDCCVTYVTSCLTSSKRLHLKVNTCCTQSACREDSQDQYVKYSFARHKSQSKIVCEIIIKRDFRSTAYGIFI
jgi:hypothetical protein